MSFSRRELLRRFGALIVVAPFVKPSSILAVDQAAITGDILPLGFAYDLTDTPDATVGSGDVFDDLGLDRYAKRLEGSIEAGGVNLAALNIMISDDLYSWPVLSTYKTKEVGSLHHGFLIHDFSLTPSDYPEIQ